MDIFFEASYHINSRDADPRGLCRPSSLMGYLQEASTGAAEAGGFTREQLLRDHHVFWMLARIWYRLERPVCWDRKLTIRTWHRGNPGMMMYRDYDLYLEGKRIGEAVSIWVLADQDSRRLFRMSHVPNLISSGGGTLCKDKTLRKICIPKDLPLADERLLRYSDTDINGHVNNSRYADFACDAIGLERAGAQSYVSSLQLGYVCECREGERLCIHAGQSDGVWYVHGLDTGGKTRFDAAVEFSPLDIPGNIA